MKIYIFLITSVLILSGCTSSKGFNRPRLRDELSVKNSEVTESEIQRALNRKPQLPLPFKIAIFFNEPRRIEWPHNESRWKWTDEDKDLISSVMSDDRLKNEISEIIIMNTSVIGSTDLKSLRLAAAQHGADALLIVKGTKDQDRYNNNWAFTYIALVTAFFVPATELDILFLSQASLWDVRNEYLYLTAEAEDIKKQTRPAYFIDDKPLIERAKKKSLKILSEEISNRLEEMNFQKK